MFKKAKRYAGTVFLLIITASQPAFAVGSGGFENASFSAASLGQGNSVVAQADEPAAISYNPAGLLQLKGVQVQSNMAFISSLTYYNSETQGSTHSTGTIAPVPTGYISINSERFLKNRVAVGVGSDSPFGLSKKYDSMVPIARYTGYDTWLKMYTIKPVVSVKVHEKLLVGAGPVYYRVFDFGGVQKYPNTLIVSGLADGQVRLDNFEANTWGWQIGILAKPHPKHQLGFYFRSPVTLRTAGLIKVENSVVGGNFETGGRAKLDLPLNMTWAYAYKPSVKTTAEVDFGYTRWSALKRLYVDAAAVNATDDQVLSAIGKADKDWADSFSVSVGGKHRLNNKFTILGGTWFYWTPVSKGHFLPNVPDSNRLGFSLGAIYSPIESIDIGITYANIFNLKRTINNDISETLGTSVDGKYFSYTQDLILSFLWRWDSFLSQKNKEKLG